MELEVGMVVRAVAGRDADGFFVVTALDGEFVWIADGDRRKLSKPKHKRRKHLRRTCTVMDLNGITDKKLRTLLRDYREQAD
ncbi:KOW domain-containing RNA-binding protein [Ruminococcus sp.]|uniref:KOW domain-containing RNA-binding protein n=1 Tax=Ruminococcus sp. TaxID=41978 RepID=UPI0025FEDAAF|nr:KOW domain-containing RNA-binding protein [Ruminococcus sp.]MCI5816858.1 KOW domain-containing RNA-binding protein [Ruminococcus sp.]